MTQLTNLTPHELNVHTPEGVEVLAPSGEVARVSVETKEAGFIAGIPLVTQATGVVTGLPDPQKGIVYVVSALVRKAVPNRDDVLSPGELRRDPEGRPIGCRGLVRNTRAQCLCDPCWEGGVCERE